MDPMSRWLFSRDRNCATKEKRMSYLIVRNQTGMNLYAASLGMLCIFKTEDDAREYLEKNHPEHKHDHCVGVVSATDEEVDKIKKGMGKGWGW